MSGFLHVFLPLLILPTGIVLILLAVAVWRKRRWPAVAALAVLYLASIDMAGGTLVIWIQSAYPPIAVTDAEKADAIVVLGGFFGPPAPRGHIANLNDASERLEAGIQLFQTGAASTLVFTGARGPVEDTTYSEGEISRDIAVRRGVPIDHIIVTEDVGNTADEARAIAALTKVNGWRRVLLVTSASHMRRAYWLFDRTGVPVTPFPVDFRFRRGSGLSVFDFLPNAASFNNTEATLRELYGFLYYRIRY